MADSLPQPTLSHHPLSQRSQGQAAKLPTVSITSAQLLACQAVASGKQSNGYINFSQQFFRKATQTEEVID